MEKNGKFIDRILKDLKKKVKKSYSSLGLTFNPFPPAGLPKLILPPLDDKIFKKIEHFIATTYVNEEYSGLTIVGDFGMGKTHLMRYIRNFINDLVKKAQEKKMDFLVATCFIDRPEDSPQSVIHKIIEDIGVDNIRKYIWKIIIYYLQKKKSTFCAEYESKQLTLQKEGKEEWDKLFEEPAKSNYLEFLKLFKKLNGDFRKLQDDMKTFIKEKIIQDSSLADRYVGLILSTEEKEVSTSWDVLAGYISKKDIQHKEILFLNSIVKILREVGFKHLYVFVDEFEDIGKLPSAKKTNYLLTLITLINRERHWSVIVSLPRSVLEEEIKKEPPLYDRLNTVRIDIPQLNEKEGEILIKNYLDCAREKASESLDPFSKENIKLMIDISKGNYRSFLLLAYNSIEEAVASNNKKITQNIIKKARDLRGV